MSKISVRVRGFVNRLRDAASWAKPSRATAAIGLSVALAGCATEIPYPQPLDLSNSAELEFIKGHEPAGLGHAGGETYSICADSSCKTRRFFVSLSQITANSVVRRVGAGEVIISAGAFNAVTTTMATCRFRVKFNVEAGHAYTVQIVNHFHAEACWFQVQHKASGLPVHIWKLPDPD